MPPSYDGYQLREKLGNEGQGDNSQLGGKICSAYRESIRTSRGDEPDAIRHAAAQVVAEALGLPADQILDLPDSVEIEEPAYVFQSGMLTEEDLQAIPEDQQTPLEELEAIEEMRVLNVDYENFVGYARIYCVKRLDDLDLEPNAKTACTAIFNNVSVEISLNGATYTVVDPGAGKTIAYISPASILKEAKRFMRLLPEDLKGRCNLGNVVNTLMRSTIQEELAHTLDIGLDYETDGEMPSAVLAFDDNSMEDFFISYNLPEELTGLPVNSEEFHRRYQALPLYKMYDTSYMIYGAQIARRERFAAYFSQAGLEEIYLEIFNAHNEYRVRSIFGVMEDPQTLYKVCLQVQTYLSMALLHDEGLRVNEDFISTLRFHIHTLLGNSYSAGLSPYSPQMVERIINSAQRIDTNKQYRKPGFKQK